MLSLLPGALLLSSRSACSPLQRTYTRARTYITGRSSQSTESFRGNQWLDSKVITSAEDAQTVSAPDYPSFILPYVFSELLGYSTFIISELSTVTRIRENMVLTLFPATVRTFPSEFQRNTALPLVSTAYENFSMKIHVWTYRCSKVVFFLRSVRLTDFIMLVTEQPMRIGSTTAESLASTSKDGSYF